MFCSNCGTQLADTAKFCHSCGTQIGQPPATATAPPEAPQQDTSHDQAGLHTIGDSATVGVNPAQAAATADLAPGTVFGDRYEVRRVLGQGGMGAVYEAFDQTLEEPVALKVMLPSLAANDQAKQRFIREAKISRRLSHRNIVRVHDMAVIDGCPCISMEYLDGFNLREFLDNRAKKKTPLKIKEVLSLAKRICEAMEYAHEMTVHRDLKPENILIGRKGTVKVTDFGIATLMDVSESKLTRGMVGTAYYMAPEQLSGRDEVDHRADIYSLGVILYEAITGTVPAGRFKAPREYRDDVADAMDEAIMEALEPNPKDRPSSMREFLEHLRGGGRAASERKADDAGGEAGYKLATGSGSEKPSPSSDKPDPKNAKRLLEKGTKELQSGDPDKALAILSQAVTLDPNLADAWFQRAQALNKAKLGTDPDEKWRRVTAGRITLNEVQETVQQIVADFKKAHELEPDNAMYALLAKQAEARMQQSSNQIVSNPSGQDAEQPSGGGFFSRLMGSGAGDVDGLVAEGNNALNGGNVDAAIKKFDQALKKDKRCAAAWYGKGLSLAKKLGNNQAEVLGRITRGEISVQEAQRIGDEAKKCLRKATKLEPGNAMYKMVASQLQ